MKSYVNPIIPGFFPDPSICRDGEDYYLVTSSFEFFPGVPLWHSRDLVNWQQIGHVLTRESQLPLKNCRVSGGIYAPTLRRHGGKWYMITTNTHQGGNFLVTAEDVLGPWSEPVWIAHTGIDPSLFWDEDGKVYYIGTWIDETDVQGIGQFRIDPATGEKLSGTKIIWHGTGGRCPEGPHMFRHNGWYYLMISEGGTEYGHMVTVARSRNVWGPFESCPRNPILSHRDHICSEFQALGHADLTTDPQGNWWMVFHAIRPTNAQLHHIGRETMLAPVTWDEEGWPVVNGGKPITAAMTGPGEGTATVRTSWSDDFSASAFHPRWGWLRNPQWENYILSSQGLTLRGTGAMLDSLDSPTFLGVRQPQFRMRYETAMTLSGDGGCGGITVLHTAEHHYDLCVRPTDSGYEVSLRKRVADILAESQPVYFEGGKDLILRVDADRDLYTFLAGSEEGSLVPIGTGRTQLLSTEAMPCTFTGCFAGLFAEGNVDAIFHGFRADPL